MLLLIFAILPISALFKKNCNIYGQYVNKVKPQQLCMQNNEKGSSK